MLRRLRDLDPLAKGGQGSRSHYRVQEPPEAFLAERRAASGRKGGMPGGGVENPDVRPVVAEIIRA